MAILEITRLGSSKTLPDDLLNGSFDSRPNPGSERFTTTQIYRRHRRQFRL
jgi:hypothetical protein